MINTDDLYFLPLGGSGEIGMNLNLYSINDQWLMVDLGVSFQNELGIEVIMPNPQFILERRDRLVGLLLTHAHEDHIGAVPYIWPRLNCPIYGTAFTLEVVRQKLDDYGVSYNPSKLIAIDTDQRTKIGPFEVELVRLTHSIPEPNGAAIRTKAGMIFHTGDWKIDPAPLVGESIDHERLRELGQEGVMALVCDSTNVFTNGVSGSESEVREHLEALISSYKDGRIVVSCFASNVARLETIALSGKNLKRKVALAGRSLHRMVEIARMNGYLTEVPDFITLSEAADLPREKVLIISTGSQGEPRAALNRFSENTQNDLKLDSGDTIIFSSRKIPGNEKAISALKNRLLKMGLNVVSDHEFDIHVSGHPARDELLEMYEWTKPQTLVPVHGEYMHMQEHSRFGKESGIPHTIIPENGSLIRLTANGPEMVEKIPSGRLGLDGEALISLSHSVIKERRRVSHEGAVFLTLHIDRDDEFSFEETQMSFLGILGSGDLKNQILSGLENMIESMQPLKKVSESEIIEGAEKVLRRTIKSVLGKRPACTVHLERG